MTRREAGAAPMAGRRDVMKTLAALPWLGSLPAAGAGEPAREPVEPFALADVRLRPGPFETARALDGRYLLSLAPDRLLHNFRVNAGLAPRAPVYGGWESEEPWVGIRCQGHTLGHYLSACALMFAATGEAAYRQRVDTIVDELAACQRARGAGLVCAFPDDDAQLLNGLAGRPVVGVPWYTLHKVMAGLRDAHLHAGNGPALGVLQRLADWIDDAARACPEERFQAMLGVEHGGMNEVLADLHALTGEARALALARRFNHRALLEPLAEGRDPLDGWHSNTQIPKVVGFERLHVLTGDERCGRAARHFWETVAERRSFATGGNGDGEHFFPASETRRHLSSAKTMETCSTHNMLRLARALFMGRPDARYADFQERALFNGILASQDPDSGMTTYFQAIRPGYPKLYGTPERSFWCCTGTGMENHAKYGDSIWFHRDRTLYVEQFISADLHWRAQGVRIRQQTAFPDEASTLLTLHAAAPVRLTLRIRHPAWCRQATFRVNGKVVAESREPGRHVDIERSWRDGDALAVDLPMHLHLAPLPDAPDVAALMFGPIVLAARLGTAGMAPGDDVIVNERTYGDVLDMPMDLPTIELGPDMLPRGVRRDAGRRLAFRLRVARPQAQWELVPFHRIAHERYNLYWQLAAGAAPAAPRRIPA
jgi:DUF1680 family protein